MEPFASQFPEVYIMDHIFEFLFLCVRNEIWPGSCQRRNCQLQTQNAKYC